MAYLFKLPEMLHAQPIGFLVVHVNKSHDKSQVSEIAAALLAWYDAHHRELPWRISPRMRAGGYQPDPYRVWLSEVMLQQTTVTAVKPYFMRFLKRWPSVSDLALADQDEVMKAWAGLGYYSRARNLKKCAETVLAIHGGRFPDTEDELRNLPGIGTYTAAAIAAIAFDKAAAVVDGNVERVMSRLFAIETPLPAAKSEIRARISAILPQQRPGDFAQATMDLGATICSPKRPKCMFCPVTSHCEALRGDDPQHFPRKAAKKQKPLRRGAAFIAVRDDDAVLLRKRAQKGLLGGMAEPPTSSWSARTDGATDIDAAPFKAAWRPAGSIRHVFTHFELSMNVFRADGTAFAAPEGWWWSPPGELAKEALPSVMKKAIEAAIPGILSK